MNDLSGLMCLKNLGIKSFRLPGSGSRLHYDAPVVIFLVTRSMTDLIREDSLFIPDTMRDSLSSTLNPEQEFDVVVAVVDRVCRPSIDYLRSHGLKATNDGFEGVSILMGESASIAPNLWQQSSIDSHSPLNDQVGSIFFDLTQKYEIPREFPKLPLRSYVVEVPLANTTFQSGQTSMLFRERWRVGSEAALPSLRLLKRQFLPRVDLILPFRHQARLLNRGVTRALTHPCTIASSMGNILSKVKIRYDSEDTEPASLELERSISSQKIVGPNDDYEVWAMITPKEEW